MKKTLIIALAGLMMFAFTQCGGNGKEKENKNEQAVEETSTVTGTKQYTDLMSAYDELGKTLKNVTTCEELEEVAMALVLGSLAMDLGSSQYSADDKMTEKEQEKMKETIEKLLKDAEKKAEKLGCEKKEYSL